jgi:hypothetical protein
MLVRLSATEVHSKWTVAAAQFSVRREFEVVSLSAGMGLCSFVLFVPRTCANEYNASL